MTVLGVLGGSGVYDIAGIKNAQWKRVKSSYGETSDEDARELSDEGIEFARVPWLPRHDS